VRLGGGGGGGVCWLRCFSNPAPRSFPPPPPPTWPPKADYSITSTPTNGRLNHTPQDRITPVLWSSCSALIYHGAKWSWVAPINDCQCAVHPPPPLDQANQAVGCKGNAKSCLCCDFWPWMLFKGSSHDCTTRSCFPKLCNSFRLPFFHRSNAPTGNTSRELYICD